MTPSATLRRKQRLGVFNRAVSWVLLVLLVLADVTYRTSADDPVVLGDSVGLSYRGLAWVLQIAMIVVLFLPFDMSGLDASRQPVGWEVLVVPFLLLNAANLIPQALFRGIACKAALTIEEANGVPPASSQTVGPV